MPRCLVRQVLNVFSDPSKPNTAPQVFTSPHYLFPPDQPWQFGGGMEKMMLETKELSRPDPRSETQS
jgi:hypothetical protein